MTSRSHMPIVTIAISTAPGPRSSYFPVLHPPAGAPALCTTRLPGQGLKTMLPATVINQAITMVNDTDSLTVVVEQSAAASFEALSHPWKIAIATREFPEAGRLINIPRGAWKLIVELPGDMHDNSEGATVRAYRHLGRQAHVDKKGYGLWIPNFSIEEAATPLPAIPEDILSRFDDDVAKARQDLADWFWADANPALDDPFIHDSHPELGLLSEISWKTGSAEGLATTLNHIFWSDPIFADANEPAKLELGCLLHEADEPREMRFLNDVACDGQKMRSRLQRALFENQPICSRLHAATPRISGLTPGRTALGITIDPPSAHQVLEAEAAMDSWLRKRGL